jgi:acetyltransferase-like isoleucine patch superfamily enzyme
VPRPNPLDRLKHAVRPPLRRTLTRILWEPPSPLEAQLRREGLGLDVGVSLTATSDTRVTVGRGCFVGRGSLLVLQRGHLKLGDDVMVGEYSNIRAFDSFIGLGSRTQLAQFVSLIAANHQVDERGVPLRHVHDLRPGRHGITIGEDCWIGTQAVVLPGVELGPRCVVGAGAVVTNSFPSDTTVIGAPARAVQKQGPSDG